VATRQVLRVPESAYALDHRSLGSQQAADVIRDSYLLAWDALVGQSREAILKSYKSLGREAKNLRLSGARFAYASAVASGYRIAAYDLLVGNEKAY
jgi:hypothetical protein